MSRSANELGSERKNGYDVATSLVTPRDVESWIVRP